MPYLFRADGRGGVVVRARACVRPERNLDDTGATGAQIGSAKNSVLGQEVTGVTLPEEGERGPPVSAVRDFTPWIFTVLLCFYLILRV